MELLNFDHLDADQSRPQQPTLPPEWVAAKVRLIYSAYRWDDFHDPEGFLAQLGVIFERYPAEIVEHVTHPMTGVQKRHEKPPVLADIVKALDARVHQLATVERYRGMGRVRTRIARTPGAPAGQSYEEMFAKHGRPTGVFEDGRQLPYSATSPKS